MKSISDELYAKQIGSEVNPYIDLALSFGATTEHFYKSRILDTEHEEQPYSHRATILLDNSDGALSEKDYKGWQAVLSYGAYLNGVDVDDCPSAPLWVKTPYQNSQPNSLTVTLSCIGVPNLLAEDRASVAYLPEADATETLKQLFEAIAGATLAPYTHCDVYQIVYGSGVTGSLFETYVPKDSFRIYRNQSRLSMLRTIIDFTECVMRFESDGKIHVFVPVTSGTTYDDEFEFVNTSPTKHPFFSKGYAESIVFPNRVVVTSLPDDDPQYSGEYIYHASYDRLASSQFEEASLTSDAQGAAIAESIMKKYVMAADGGNITLPIMSFCAESFDYVKVTDERQGDERVGNIGKLVRRWNPSQGVYSLTIWFGGWLSVRQTMNDLADFPTGFGTKGVYFSRLTVKDLVAENITATNMDFYWLDPDNTIDITKILGEGNYFTLDDVPNGELYGHVKLIHVDAEGGLILNEAVVYAAGFDPRDKFDLGDNDYDDIPEGSIYKRLLETQVDAGKIKLSDECAYVTGFNPSEKRRTFTGTPVPPYSVGDLWLDATSINKLCKVARDSGSFVAGDWTAVTLDSISNGTTYSRVSASALTAQGLILLDQVVEGEFGLIYATDIESGSIKLSATVPDADHRVVSDAEKSVWNSKPDNMDEIAMGVYFRKVSKDQVTTGGYLTINSYTQFAGKWYDQPVSGVSIDATNGIILYGSSTAFRTRQYYGGADQCYMGSDGSIWAGVNKVRLNSNGISLFGNCTNIYDSSSNLRGQMYGTTLGLLFQGFSNVVLSSHMIPNGSGINLGSSSYYWNNIYTSYGTIQVDLSAYTAVGAKLGSLGRFSKVYGNPILSTTYVAPATEGELVMVGGGSASLYIYSGGGWRTNS